MRETSVAQKQKVKRCTTWKVRPSWCVLMMMMIMMMMIEGDDDDDDGTEEGYLQYCHVIDKNIVSLFVPYPSKVIEDVIFVPSKLAVMN